MRKFCFSSIMLLTLLFALTNIAGAAVKVAPESIGVGLNFSGSTVTVTGAAPAGSEICIRVTSSPVRVPLNRQGKVAGFWMSVEKAVIEGVPKVYQVYTSSSLKNFPESLRQNLNGYQDATVNAKVTEKKEEGERSLSAGEAQPFLTSLVDMYRKKGLYAVHEGKVEVANGRFTARIAVPAGTPQGKIDINAFAFKGGQVIARENTSFTVESTGMVRWLRVLSGTDGPVYGGVSVMIALFAGLVVGMSFAFLDRLLAKGRADGAGAHAH
ncbi:MAG: TIGR02186 family protein [Bacillota bacterium]